MRTIDIMYCIVRRTSRFVDVYRMAHGEFPSLDQVEEHIRLVKLFYWQNKE